MLRELISVIIPIYNVEKYLCRCLDSVINQTYKNLEIILVDDGSPDGSGEICDAYAKKDSRIKVIHKENGGVSSARNAGLDVATGEYIGFVDPDDYVTCDMFEFMINEAHKDDCDIVQCNYSEVDDKGKERRYLDNIKNTIYTDVDDAVCALIENQIRCCVWNKLFKKEVVANVYFNPELRMAEDRLFLNYCLHNAKRIKTTNKYCYYYYISNTSVVHSGLSEKYFDCVKVEQELFEMYKSNKKICAIVKMQNVNTIFGAIQRIFMEGRFTEKLPDLIKLLLSYKKTILKGDFPVYKKIIVIMFSISPTITSRILSLYYRKR